MGMHPTTVRFSDALWALIQAEADTEGVSTSAFIRDAALARVLIAEARRGGTEDWARAIRIVRGALADEE